MAAPTLMPCCERVSLGEWLIVPPRWSPAPRPGLGRGATRGTMPSSWLPAGSGFPDAETRALAPAIAPCSTRGQPRAARFGRRSGRGQLLSRHRLEPARMPRPFWSDGHTLPARIAFRTGAFVIVWPDLLSCLAFCDTPEGNSRPCGTQAYWGSRWRDRFPSCRTGAFLAFGSNARGTADESAGRAVRSGD